MKPGNHKNKFKKIMPLIAIFILTIVALIYNDHTYKNLYIKIDQGNFDQIGATRIEIKDLASALSNRSPNQKSTSLAPIFTIQLKHPFYGQDQYEILSIDDQGVSFQFEGNTFIANTPDFFYSSPWFDNIYNDLAFADANLSIHNHESGLVQSLSDLSPTDINWYFEKYDGQWYPYDAPQMNNNNDYIFDATESDLVVYFDKSPNEVSINYEKEGSNTLLISDVSYEYDGFHLPTPDTDGVYTYHLTGTWEDDDDRYKGTIKYHFTVRYIRPTVYTFTSTALEQGQPLIVHAQYLDQDEVPEITQNIYDDQVFSFSPDVKYDTLILPTNYTTKPGTYEITIDGTTTEITVSSRDFNVQHLIIDESVATSTRNDAAYIEFDEKFDPARLISESVILSEGAFILPVNGRLSTEFGETRDVNGSPTTYRHSGWDIAAPRGTPIKAANSGIVTFSEPLILTGNTVVIDHGGGIFSIYFHMDTLDKVKGDYVYKGDEIGSVGSTGFSTGPHLHFIISWYDQNLEPGWFIYGQAITYDNYKSFFQ